MQSAGAFGRNKMVNAELKTEISDEKVEKFLRSVADERQRADSVAVLEMMSRISNEEPKMWGPSIIGFGRHHLKYASGRELDWMLIGFSPRKGKMTLYITDGFEKYDSYLARLGKHTTGKSCLYIKHLTDVDINVLEELVASSLEHVRGGAMYPAHQ